MTYTFSCIKASHGEAIDRMAATPAGMGFGVLAATMRSKPGMDLRPCTILGAGQAA